MSADTQYVVRPALSHKVPSHLPHRQARPVVPLRCPFHARSAPFLVRPITTRSKKILFSVLRAPYSNCANASAPASCDPQTASAWSEGGLAGYGLDGQDKGHGHGQEHGHGVERWVPGSGPPKQGTRAPRNQGNAKRPKYHWAEERQRGTFVHTSL